MDDILKIISEITKYGLRPSLEIIDKEADLEKNLVKIYSKYFEIKYEFDNKKYADFNKVEFPNILENVRKNFPDFGLYHEVLDCH